MRFMDKLQLTTIQAINEATTESELNDIYTYLENHHLFSHNVNFAFFKNPVTHEYIIQSLLNKFYDDLYTLDNHALLFLASNPNTPSNVLEEISELPINDSVKQALLNNPGTPYHVKENLDTSNAYNVGLNL